MQRSFFKIINEFLSRNLQTWRVRIDILKMLKAKTKNCQLPTRNTISSKLPVKTEDLYFPSNWWCWATFDVTVGHFFGEMSIYIFYVFFSKVICFSAIELQVFLIYLDINTLSDNGLQIFSLIKLPFHDVHCFSMHIPLSLMQSQLFIFVFVACAFGVMSRIIAQTNVKKYKYLSNVFFW